VYAGAQGVVGKKRKQQRGDPHGDRVAQAKPKPPPRIGTQLGALFAQAGVDKAKPKAPRKPSRAAASAAAGPRTLPPPGPAALQRVAATIDHEQPAAPIARTGSELRILNDAYVGVQPLSGGPRRTRRVALAPGTAATPAALRAEARTQDAAARARLDALVGGGVRFKVRYDGEARDFVEGLREAASHKLLERLASKAFAPEATLDLHGVRAAEVARLLTSFLRNHARAGARHLLVITGKGLHAEAGVSTLRQVVVETLTRGGAAPVVQAFATAHASHGGSGALAVLLG
jgi:DNA-nicking Smr family endonuclease